MSNNYKEFIVLNAGPVYQYTKISTIADLKNKNVIPDKYSLNLIFFQKLTQYLEDGWTIVNIVNMVQKDYHDRIYYSLRKPIT